MTVLRWVGANLLGSFGIKWAVMALLWFGGVLLVNMVLGLLPGWFSAAGVSGAITSMPAAMGYFFNYFQGPAGISMIFSAVSVRFLMRFVPFFK